MIDIHTHILHGTDDGARDLTDALLMAGLAAEGGTGTMIATPHGNIPDGYGKPGVREDAALLIGRKNELEQGLKEKGIDLTIMLGMEVFATEDVAEKIRDGRVLSMPDGSHYMLEFDPGMPGMVCDKILEDVLGTGARPIIAHPERYVCIQENPELAMRWHEMGCEFQMNPEGILGRAAPLVCRTATRMLEADLVEYVASDTHDPYDRTPFLGDVYEFFKGNRGSAYADRVMWENPMKLLLRGDSEVGYKIRNEDRGIYKDRGRDKYKNRDKEKDKDRKQIWRFKSDWKNGL